MNGQHLTNDEIMQFNNEQKKKAAEAKKPAPKPKERAAPISKTP